MTNGIELLYLDRDEFVVEITTDEGFEKVLEMLENAKGRADDEREI